MEQPGQTLIVIQVLLSQGTEALPFQVHLVVEGISSPAMSQDPLQNLADTSPTVLGLQIYSLSYRFQLKPVNTPFWPCLIRFQHQPQCKFAPLFLKRHQCISNNTFGHLYSKYMILFTLPTSIILQLLKFLLSNAYTLL